jgi:hypothetical protein
MSRTTSAESYGIEWLIFCFVAHAAETRKR